MIYESELVEFEDSVAMLLPQQLLDKLGLSEGDDIVFIRQDDGKIVFKPLDKTNKDVGSSAD